MKKSGIIILSALIFINFNLVFTLRAEETKQEPSPQAEVKVPTEAKPSEESKVPQEKEEKAEASPVPALIEIKRLKENAPVYSFELRNAEIGDVFRVLAHDFKLNLLISSEVQGKITASLSSVTLERALGAIADLQNLTLERRKGMIKVSLNLVTETFTLKYIEAKTILYPGLAQAQKALGTSVAQAMAAARSTQASATASQSSSSATVIRQASSIYDLLSEKGKVLLGTQPNSIMVIDYPPNIVSIREFIKMVDQKIMTRVFKLKYLKASEILGEISTQTQATTSSMGSSTTTGSSTTSTASH